MEHTNEALSVSFTLPDKFTVRMQLSYYSNLARGSELFERYWLGALAVLENWKCERIPDPLALNLDEVTDPKITDVILWVGLEVKRRMDTLEDVPKNS